MEDYTFYGIFAPKEGCIYIGKTTDFKLRCDDHKRRISFSKVKVYKVIRELGGWEVVSIRPVYRTQCTDEFSRDIEQAWIEHFYPKGNSVRAKKGKTAWRPSDRECFLARGASKERVDLLFPNM